MEESWKDIKGYDGGYQISSLGRVWSSKTKRYLALSDNGRGYLHVNLWKDNKSKNEYVHRLVAIHFIDNPNHLPQVNHKDENKQNNSADNLEWCDNAYNNAYGTKPERQGETLLSNGKTSYKVNQYDLNGNYIATYRSMREAERINNLANGVLSQYFLNHYSQCGGYRWTRA